MRIISTYLLLLIVLCSFVSVYSQDDEIEGIGVEITATTLSRYVWRGYDLSHKDPALLTYVNYSPKVLDGFSLSAGTIFGLKNAREQGDRHSDIDEFDLTAAYERPIIPDKLILSVSVLFYQYTSHWTRSYYEDTKDVELNFMTIYTFNKYLIPYVSYFRGIDDKIRGNFVETGFSNEFALSEHIALTPKWYACYSSQYEFRSDPAFSNLAAEFPLGYSKGPIYAEISGIVVKPLRNSLNGNKKILFCTSLNVSYAF